MNKKSFLFYYSILLYFLNPAHGLSQTMWTKTYGSSGSDQGFSVHQTTDGGYVVTGYKSYSNTDYDVWLIKTDENGDTLWTKTFGGELYEAGSSVWQTKDEGYVITGSKFSTVTDYDVWLIKTDENGDTLWTKTFGGELSETGSSVWQTKDEGYVITGSKLSPVTDYDVWLIKTDTNGDTLWTKTYGGTLSDRGLSVQQTTDEGYIIAGFTSSFGSGLEDAWLIKTDAEGDTLWTKTFGGELSELGSSVQQTLDGGYVLVSPTYSFGHGGSDIWLVKTDAYGDTLWTKTYGENLSDWGRSVEQTSDGGYIITGYTTSSWDGSDDVWLIKTDLEGNMLWTKTYGGNLSDWGRSVEQTSDGGYIITGSTISFGIGVNDVWLIKTDSLGNTTVPKSADQVLVDIGKVQNVVSNSTIIVSASEDIQTFLIGRDDHAQASMIWLEGGYPQNHYLYYGSFRIGYNNDFVRFSTLTSNDWIVYRNDPGQVSPFIVQFSMTDSLADKLKVGVKCLCKVYAWSDMASDDFLIYEYFIINTSDGPLTDVYAGFHIDGDISSAGGGSGVQAYYRDDMMSYYLSADTKGNPESISYMYDGDNPNIYGDDSGGNLVPKESLGFLGSRVLACPASKDGMPANQQSGHQWWDWNHDPQSGADWYNFMSLKQFKGDTTEFHDYRYFQTLGPWDINSRDTIRIAFALGLGEGLTGLRENLQTAYDLYWSEITSPTAVYMENTDVPEKFELKQNYPNPFNPRTTIEFAVPKTEFVTLKVFNILGQQVATLVSEKVKPGRHKFDWIASEFSSGIYYCFFKAGNYYTVKKMILIK